LEVDDPPGPVREAQVLREVLAEIRQVVEGDAVPEAPASPALEEPFAQDMCHGAI